MNTSKPIFTEAERREYLRIRNQREIERIRFVYYPAKTSEQQQEHDEYVKRHNLPF